MTAELMTDLDQILAIDLAEEVLTYAIIKRPEIFPMIHSHDAICVIALYLASEQYMKISYGFSHGLLLDILEYFQVNENYEKCLKIVKQIEEANQLFPFLMLTTK